MTYFPIYLGAREKVNSTFFFLHNTEKILIKLKSITVTQNSLLEA